MAYYKGTEAEANAYNKEVSDAQNYQGQTQKYSNVYEIESFWYVSKHEDFTSDMVEVDNLPATNEEV